MTVNVWPVLFICPRELWQTRYLWVKDRNMYYTKGPTDDLANANSIPIDAITYDRVGCVRAVALASRKDGTRDQPCSLFWLPLCRRWCCAGVCAGSGTSAKVGKKGNGRFNIETAWGRSFEFMVKNVGEAKEWVQVIKEAMAYWKVIAAVLVESAYRDCPP